jgi:hypothetical protein
MRTTKAWSLASLIVAALFSCLAVQAQQTFSLAWNANPEPDIVSYRVYVGTSSRQYTQSFPTESPSISLSSLPSAPVYYFAVTALNSAGIESSFSEEVSSAAEPAGPVLTQTLNSSALVLTVSTLPGATVTFESSTDLANWAFYINRVANNRGLATLSQPRSSMLPVRFFRVRAP